MVSYRSRMFRVNCCLMLMLGSALSIPPKDLYDHTNPSKGFTFAKRNDHATLTAKENEMIKANLDMIKSKDLLDDHPKDQIETLDQHKSKEKEEATVGQEEVNGSDVVDREDHAKNEMNHEDKNDSEVMLNDRPKEEVENIQEGSEEKPKENSDMPVKDEAKEETKEETQEEPQDGSKAVPTEQVPVEPKNDMNDEPKEVDKVEEDVKQDDAKVVGDSESKDDKEIQDGKDGNEAMATTLAPTTDMETKTPPTTAETTMTTDTNSNALHCFVCEADDDPKCSIHPSESKPCKHNMGCYTMTKRNSTWVKRGCKSDMSSEDTNFCDTSKSCKFCLEQNCNDKSSTNGTMGLQAPFTLVGLFLAFFGFQDYLL